MTSRAVVMALALTATSCGATLMKLPSGASSPAPDASAALLQATRACRAVRTLTAEIAVSGSVAGQRVRGRLLTGIATPASARLEGLAPFGPPLFIFVARGDDATLLLPRDNRFLEHGKAGAVLEALTGVPLDGADLQALLTGCPETTSAGEARRFGDAWIVVPIGAGEVYLHRDNNDAPWVVAAQLRRAGTRQWRDEFRDHQDGIPRTIRVTSVDDQGRTGVAFDLRLALTQVELNAPLGAEVFVIKMPPGAQPIALDELRRAGPLGAPASDGR